MINNKKNITLCLSLKKVNNLKLYHEIFILIIIIFCGRFCNSAYSNLTVCLENCNNTTVFENGKSTIILNHN